jgi:hypothetical protein
MVYSKHPSLAGLKILPQERFCNGFSLSKATKVLIFFTMVTQAFAALIQLTKSCLCISKVYMKGFKKNYISIS